MNTYAYVGGNPVSRIDPNGKEAILAGICAAAVGINTVTSFYDTMKTLDSTRMVQDQLIRVNERIGNCPASDTKKLGELNAIRSDLVSMLGKGVGQEINVANSGLTGIGKGIALEGVCAVLLLIPAL